MALNPLLKKLVSQSAAKYKGGNSKLSKLKDGRNVIRLIAPAPGAVAWVGEDSKFFRELGVHWIKPEANAKPIAVVGSEEICYQRVSALAAAIDMAIANAYDEDTKKLYEEWKARKSIIVNIVNRDANDEVQTLELTPTTFGKIMDLVNLYDESGVDVLDPNVGMDLVITKTGKGLNTSYDVAAVPLAPGKTFKPVTAEQINQAENLDDFITTNYFRGDEQKALNAVATIAGIQIPQIGKASTPTAALTSQAATVDTSVMETTVQPATAAPAVAATVSMTPEQMQAEIARQAALLAAQQQQQAAVAQAAVAQANVVTAPAAAAAPAATATTSISDLGQDEQDALLAELNAIGG